MPSYLVEGYFPRSRADELTGLIAGLRALAHSVAGEEDETRERAAHPLAVADRTSGRPAEHFARTALGAMELSLGRAA